MKRLLLSVSFLLAAAGSASAYTSYILPDDFWPDDANVRLDASYATSFFTPQIALSTDFAAVQPDGSSGIFSQMETGAQSTVLTGALPRGGTYRFSSGEVLGSVGQVVGVDGTWRPLAAGETPPEGAQVTTIQSVTVADVYVTRGAPTRDAVDRNIGRLALHPVTHPNQILVSGGFQVQLLFDGQPFANMPIVLYSAGDPESKLDRFFVTDASGTANIPLDQPGQYIIAARHRAAAPAGAEAAVQSYTTTLTFEALTELPAFQEVAAEPVEQPRRRRSPPAGRQGSRVGGIRH